MRKGVKSNVQLLVNVFNSLITGVANYNGSGTITITNDDTNSTQKVNFKPTKNYTFSHSKRPLRGQL